MDIEKAKRAAELFREIDSLTVLIKIVKLNGFFELVGNNSGEKVKFIVDPKYNPILIDSLEKKLAELSEELSKL